MSEIDLSVVIPTHNAQDTIGELLNTFLSIPELSVQVVLVDDCSTDGTPDLLQTYADKNANVLFLRNERNLGAGVARNIGFPHAVGRYTLFFDDDDLVHPDTVVKGVRALDQGGQDLVLMKYRYRRAVGDDNEAMTNQDMRTWEKYVGDAKSRTVTLDGAPELLSLTNYPWNRIIRTKRYQDVGLKYGSTMVNNDILGHWYTLLFADKILLLNEVVCTHIVLAGGNNLTNRASRDRLTLFDALDETLDLLEANPALRRRYAHLYWSSVITIADWAKGRVSPDVRPELAARLEEHLLRISVVDFSSISLKRDPELAELIIQRTGR